MNAIISAISKRWYHTTILGLYGFAIFYLGHFSNNGWEQIAQVQSFWQAVILLSVRLVIIIFLCTKVAFLAFDVMYPEADSYARRDVWYYMVNFALVVHITELAIIDILLHGI